MRWKWPVLLTMVLTSAGYAAYPYITLFQLQSAVRGGDAMALSAMIDWPAVRAGIKEDICDLVLDDAPNPATTDALPAFGASFVRGVTGNAVDREITVESLAGSRQATLPAGGDPRIEWAFFNDLTHFSVHVAIPGQSQLVKIELALNGPRWKVMRVWLPGDLLAKSHLRA